MYNRRSLDMAPAAWAQNNNNPPSAACPPTAQRPTPEQMTFGHLILHTAIANGKVCSAITGAAEPKIDVKDTDPKEKLIQAFKESFEFCSAQLANVDDSKLGEEVSLFGGRATRARALIELPIDWADHYAGQAMYLRLNGILPPTAQPKKPAGEK